MKKYLLPILFFISLLCSWEYTSLYFSNMLFILPPPSKILYRLWEARDRFYLHTHVTFREMTVGFVMAFVFAFPLAWVMYLWGSARAVLQPLFVIIQCLPMFALAPIMVIWFGWSFTAIVVPTALMIFFPLTMNIYQGLRSTPENLIDYFRIHSASPWQTFTKLQLPWSLPHICSGFKIAAGIAGVGAVAGEWAGAQQGLGVMMLESRRGADLESTFAALLCLTGISLGLYSFIVWLEDSIQKRRSTLKLAMLLVPLMLITGCQREESKQVRLVLDWVPNPNHVAVFVGIDQGFFAEHAIDMYVQKVHDPGDTLSYLTSTQAELALSYMPHTMRAINKGVTVEPIAVLIECPLNSLIYRRDSGIKTIQDLNDKILGYCVDGSQSRFLDSLLRMNHLVPQSKRNVSFDLVTTLGTQQVDVIYGGYWNIEKEHLRSYGVETDHFMLTELGMPNYYELIFVANQNSPQTDPEFIERFKKGLKKSIEFVQANPEKAFEIYIALNPDKSDKTLAWERDAWKITSPVLAKDPSIDPSVWSNFHAWLKENAIM